MYSGKPLIDRYDRHLNYLRISITDRCNLNCIYCVPDALIPKFAHRDILRYEEILRLVTVGAKLGINKVRVTGGEPLVRKDSVDFLANLTAVPGLRDVSLTTNGVMLPDRIDALKAAGVRRLNISLDTLDPAKYERITGKNAFHRVWDGIMNAHAAGFSPIKLNVVALPGINEDEIDRFAALSMEFPFHVRFIEYMPIGGSHPTFDKPLLGPEILQRLSAAGALIPVGRSQSDGPAERYRFAGAAGEIGIIRPLSRHFCGDCNRLRLTAEGKLRACLLSDRYTNIRGPLRSGAGDAELAEVFRTAVRFKPHAHELAEGHRLHVNDPMASIGG